MDIIEKDKLIWIFMDRNPLDARYVMPNFILYHKSYDWLMPVIKKIKIYVESRDSQYTVCSSIWNDIQIELLAINFDDLYKKVIEFIEQYNENKDL